MKPEKYNEELEKLLAKLPVAITNYEKASQAYWKRYYQLYLGSGMATLPLKEAETKGILDEEELSAAYQDAKLELKILEMQKELYIELSKNLRGLK